MNVKNSAISIAECAVMTATLSLSKFALSFLPNFEIVTLLIFVYTAVFGLGKTIISIVAFILLDMAFYGAQIWVISYLLHFPFVSVLAFMLVRFKANELVTALSALFVTFLFGVQTTLLEHWAYNMNFWTRYLTGITFFITHICCNFVLVLVAVKPLVKALLPLKNKIEESKN